jgi:K+-transporting ATPase A subunit
MISPVRRGHLVGRADCTLASGRFDLEALPLLLARRLATQGRKPTTIGSLPCDTVTFGVLVFGALCLLPALALGQIAEHLQF